MDPASEAYAADCLGWKCTICGPFAKDQVELEMQLIENEKIVLSKNDNMKWVRCEMCLTKYHLTRVTTESEEKVAKEIFVCTFEGCK